MKKWWVSISVKFLNLKKKSKIKRLNIKDGSNILKEKLKLGIKKELILRKEFIKLSYLYKIPKTKINLRKKITWTNSQIKTWKSLPYKDNLIKHDQKLNNFNQRFKFKLKTLKKLIWILKLWWMLRKKDGSKLHQDKRLRFNSNSPKKDLNYNLILTIWPEKMIS